MYNDGCEYYEKKKQPIKFLLDLGYLEGECGFCKRNEHCFIQDNKTVHENVVLNKLEVKKK